MANISQQEFLQGGGFEEETPETFLQGGGFTVEERPTFQAPTPERRMGLGERISRIFLPKAAEGFAETIGTTLATPELKRAEEEPLQEALEMQPQIMRQLRDPNISRERKLRLAEILITGG